MKKTPTQKLLAAGSLVSILALTGCASGPYAPKSPLPPPEPVVKSQPEPKAPEPERDEKPKRKATPSPKPVPVNLSIGPRDPEQAFDLSVDGPLVIPKEVFEE